MITSARPHLSEAAHWYFRDGRPCYDVPNKSRPGETRKTTIADARKLDLLPSPTSICKLLHRHALVEWQIEQAVLATMTAPKKEGESLDDFVQRIIHTERHQDEERDIAAERGREIHRALQLAMTSDVLLLAGYIREPVEFLRKTGRTVATEKVVVGEGYAGMLDLQLENESEVWIVDYKGVKTILEKQYNEQQLQVAAYAGALGNTGDKRIRCANLYISTTEPGKWTIIESENWPEDYRRFQLLVQYHKLTNKL